MPQVQGTKGEAVVVYCEPLITQEMGYPRLSRRVNKMGFCSKMYILLIEDLRKYIQTYKMRNKFKHIKYFSRFVYDQCGLKLFRSKRHNIVNPGCICKKHNQPVDT